MSWFGWLKRPVPSVRRTILEIEELEARTTPTGNLILTNALLVNANNQPQTPDIGEQVFLQADWTTQDIPVGAAYTVSYSVDGVTLSSSSLTFGTGVTGTGFWNWYLGGWFAGSGTHNVTVTLDPGHTVPETSYADNSISFTFTPVSAPDLPQKFITPLGGTPFQTWGIVNYVDVNPFDPNIADYHGGDYTYDTHQGHDMTLANFGSMDAGVPVLAAAAGTVVAVVDGNFDRETTMGSQPSNYVEIDHGNGWETLYYHLRDDSIIVKVGDHVVAGQVLGLVGSSGDSTLAHLHFQVMHDGDVVEPEYDPNTFWVNPLPYQGTVRSVLDSGVSSTATLTGTDLAAEERPVAANVFAQAAGQQLSVWFQDYTSNNDSVAVKFYQPNGTLYPSLGTSFTATESRGGYEYFFWNLPANLTLGTWHVGIEINGVEMARDSFQVTSTGAGFANVTQGTTYVPNNRNTPIDFGTVAPGATAPQQTFTVTNIGSANLTISKLVLPSGFTLVGTFPTPKVLAIGQSTTFTVQLPTATSGTNLGSVTLLTDDPNTPAYSFVISGTVSGGNSGAIHGQVFQDANGDALENGPDAGLTNWTVALLNPGTNTVIATTMTGNNGYYTFLNLAPGTYRVRATVPSGWTQTTANPADTVVGTTNVLAGTFGNFNTSAVVPGLDVDGNGKSDPLTDGVLILRYLFGFTGTTLTAGALGAGATRTDPAAIVSFLASSRGTMLDADGNGSAAALTDGVLILRYLFGFTGTTLTSGAIGSGATRTTPVSIQTYLNSYDPYLGHLFADGTGPGAAPADLVTTSELQAVTAAAIARWEATDLSSVAIAKLQSAQVQIADLDGTSLGQTHGNDVLIDRDAAGYGWFVDLTPLDDTEFTFRAGANQLDALSGSAAANHMDLLTVVMHELGLVMGLKDIDPSPASPTLMTDVLLTGVRRLP